MIGRPFADLKEPEGDQPINKYKIKSWSIIDQLLFYRFFIF